MFIYDVFIGFIISGHYKDHWEPNVENEWGGD